MGDPIAVYEVQSGQGESTSNTLVALYLILLTFFIAMHALADKRDVRGAAVLEGVNRTFSGRTISPVSSGFFAAPKLSGLSALDNLIRDQDDLRLALYQSDGASRELLVTDTFFFAPDSLTIRRDRIDLLNKFGEFLAQNGEEWRLAIFMPDADYPNGQRALSLEQALIDAGAPPASLLLGQIWFVDESIIRLGFVPADQGVY